MRSRRPDIRVGFSAAVCLWAALLLLILPLRWLLAAAAAAVWHELCHILAIHLCGGHIYRIQIGGAGAVLKSEPLGTGQKIFCILAGPAGGFALLLVVRWLPALAICGVMHSLYNLLPIWPLDGGRALRCGIGAALPPDKADTLCEWIRRICCLALLAAGGYAAIVLRLGLFPLLAAVFLVDRTGNGKIPCKPAPQGVQ